MSVVPLRPGLEPTVREANPDVVAALEELLEMARGGEILGFAIGMNHPGDLTAWRVAGRKTRALLGAIEMMKYDMRRTDLDNQG